MTTDVRFFCGSWSSANNVLFYPPFVCLFVCLLVTSRKKLVKRSSCKFCQRQWRTLLGLHFTRHPHPDLDQGIFEKVFNMAKTRHFSKIWLMFLENWWDIYENVITDVSVDKEVPVKFGCDGVVMYTESGSQLNMRAVYLHVLGDALGSVVVIISAIFIKFLDAEWKYKIDPVLRFASYVVCLCFCVDFVHKLGV